MLDESFEKERSTTMEEGQTRLFLPHSETNRTLAPSMNKPKNTILQRRILVLQDTEFRPILERALAPFHVLTYYDRVNDALDALRSASFDLIISQVHLQEDDMFDFLLQVDIESVLPV
jgi:PleD family two-component response regulator